MSRLGPLTFGKKEEQIFLGREIAQHRDFSEETARQIDLEVRRLIDEAYQSAHSILEAHQDAMHRIAAALLERETIDAEEVRMLIEGKELPPIRSILASPSEAPAAAAPQQVLKPETRGGPRLPRGLAFAGITITCGGANCGVRRQTVLQQKAALRSGLFCCEEMFEVNSPKKAPCPILSPSLGERVGNHDSLFNCL